MRFRFLAFEVTVRFQPYEETSLEDEPDLGLCLPACKQYMDALGQMCEDLTNALHKALSERDALQEQNNALRGADK